MSAQTPVPGLLRSFSGDYLAAQRDVSQNTIYAYRGRDQALPPVRSTPPRPPAAPPPVRRSRRRHRAGVPDLPRVRPEKQRGDPELPAGRDPPPLRLRRRPRPPARAAVPPGPGHPAQEDHLELDDLPEPGRGQGPAGRAAGPASPGAARPGPAHPPVQQSYVELGTARDTADPRSPPTHRHHDKEAPSRAFT